MPTVPGYGGQRVDSTALPGARISPEAPAGAFGVPAHLDLSGAANVAQEVYLKERDRADQVAVTDADSQNAAFITDLLYNPETGLLLKQGHDAFNVPNEANDAWEHHLSEVESKLTSDRQHLAFHRAALARYAELNEQVQKHVGAQRQAYDAGVVDAYVKNETASMITNYGDVERVMLGTERIKAVVGDYATHHGWSPEETQQKVGERVSAAMVGVINHMVADRDSNYTAAKNLYARTKDLFVGDDQTAVERTLSEAGTRDESRKQADAIVAAHPTIGDALTAARAIENTAVRDATVERVRSYFSDNEAAHNLEVQQAYDQAEEYIKQGRSVPPHVWSQLTVEQQRGLEQVESAPAVSNTDAWLNFLELSRTPGALEGMSKIEFRTKYWSRLSASDRNQAESLWLAAGEAARNGNAKNPQLTATLDFNQRVDGTLRNTGLVPPALPAAKMNDGQKQLYINFQTEAAKRVEQAELAKGRKLVGTEIQSILDEMATEQVFINKPWRRDPKEMTYIVAPTDRQHAYVPVKQIPDIEQASIKNVIRSLGKRITTDKIQRAYAAYLLGDRQLFDAITRE